MTLLVGYCSSSSGCLTRAIRAVDVRVGVRGQNGGGSSSVANRTRDSIRPGGAVTPFDAAASPAETR